MDTPGIEIRPLVDMTGDANFNEAYRCVGAKYQIVGQRGQEQVANAILGHERGHTRCGDEPTQWCKAIDARGEHQWRAYYVQSGISRSPYEARGAGARHAIQRYALALRQNYKNQDVHLAGMIVKLIGTELCHEIERLHRCYGRSWSELRR